MVNEEMTGPPPATCLNTEQTAAPFTFKHQFSSSLRTFLYICLPLVGLVAGLASLSMPSVSAATTLKAGQDNPPRLRAPDKGRAKVDFKLTEILNGLTKDGVWTATFKMLGSNGHVVYKITIPYDSATHAENMIQDQIKLADKILRASPQVSGAGRESGQRILATFPVRTPADHRFRLIWRSGSSFHEIDGDTLQDVLDLETYMDATMTKLHRKQ
jgi:hypothetical protein